MVEINKKFHEVQNISFDGDLMYLKVDSDTYEIDLNELAKTSPLLLKANNHQRACYQATASGNGILWLSIDEALSVDGLIKIGKRII